MATDTHLFSLVPFLSFWPLQRQRKWVIVDRTRVPSGTGLLGPDFQGRRGFCVFLEPWRIDTGTQNPDQTCIWLHRADIAGGGHRFQDTLRPPWMPVLFLGASFMLSPLTHRGPSCTCSSWEARDALDSICSDFSLGQINGRARVSPAARQAAGTLGKEAAATMGVPVA